MKHNIKTVTIGLFQIGQEPKFINAVKTSIVYLPQLESTLANCNSQVKQGFVWKEVAK